MKNVDILPNTLVPIEIRLEVYEKAIELIEKDENFADTKDNKEGFSTCLLLPCLLWDLEDYKSNSPSGRMWSFHHINNQFPEWTSKIIKKIESVHSKEEKDKLRIKYLKQSVNSIKKQLVK